MNSDDRTIEETWTAEWDQFGGYDCMSSAWIVRTGAVRVEVPEGPRSETVAKLVAAAPDMARVLLDIEHVPTGYDQALCCPVCGMQKACDRKSWPSGHVADCSLHAALRKAGVAS